jgi:sugar phosphate isomerase/epimerase
LLSSFPLDFQPALSQAAALGFTHVDVVALADRPVADLDALAESGLLVACAALGRNLPDGQSLDAVSVEERKGALEQIKLHIADAGHLGARHAYLVPGMDGSADGLARFTEACSLLADYAAARKVRLLVEHIPGRALPTVAATLHWLEQTDHNNLYLLVDVGHCVISGDDAAEAVRAASDRLGYIHFDDNDGARDLHWPLLHGRLTRDRLKAVITALRAIRYDGALSLELSAGNPDPLGGLREGKRLLEELLQRDCSRSRGA